MKRTSIALVVALTLLLLPSSIAARTTCQQYHEPGGGCETICDFYDNVTNEWQGSITYGWCN